MIWLLFHVWLANHNDSFTWFSINILPPICNPNLVLLMGLEKTKKLNLNVKNIFATSHFNMSYNTSFDKFCKLQQTQLPKAIYHNKWKTNFMLNFNNDNNPCMILF